MTRHNHAMVCQYWGKVMGVLTYSLIVLDITLGNRDYPIISRIQHIQRL